MQLHSHLDLKAQLQSAVRCLEAMIPFCNEAGIATSLLDAYDEWDVLVEGVYRAFLILPICNSGTTHSPDDFGKIGFELSGRKLYLAVHYRNEDFILKDLVNFRTTKIGLEVASPADPNSIQIVEDIEEVSRVQIESPTFPARTSPTAL